MCPALNAEAGGGGYSSQMYPVPAERRVRRVIEPERPHRRRHAWHGADDPRIVTSLRRCTQAVCLPPIAEQGCPHAVTIFIEARDAPIESTAHIILERYVTCRTGNIDRSEEHTSELQSLMRISNAVLCLKKKNNHNKRI